MNRISSSLDNPSNPLLEAMDRAKQAENDGIDMIQDDHKSQQRSGSYLSSYTANTQDNKPVE